MKQVTIALTDEQATALQELAKGEIDAANVSGGDAALAYAANLFVGYAFGKMLDGIASSNPDISGRQISEIVGA